MKASSDRQGRKLRWARNAIKRLGGPYLGTSKRALILNGRYRRAMAIIAAHKLSQ